MSEISHAVWSCHVRAVSVESKQHVMPCSADASLRTRYSSTDETCRWAKLLKKVKLIRLLTEHSESKK